MGKITGPLMPYPAGFLTSFTLEYWIVTTRLFFVGLVWSVNNVVTTAMLGDSTPPHL